MPAVRPRVPRKLRHGECQAASSSSAFRCVSTVLFAWFSLPTVSLTRIPRWLLPQVWRLIRALRQVGDATAAAALVAEVDRAVVEWTVGKQRRRHRWCRRLCLEGWMSRTLTSNGELADHMWTARWLMLRADCLLANGPSLTSRPEIARVVQAVQAAVDAGYSQMPFDRPALAELFERTMPSVDRAIAEHVLRTRALPNSFSNALLPLRLSATSPRGWLPSVR